MTATLPDPVTSVDPALIHGFDDTGFIQNATVDATNANCANTTDPHRFGGTLTLNHGPVVVPCNLVIQMPANTFTWADFVHGGPALGLGVAYPSFEVRAVGNIVGARRIAGLLYASQQFLHTSTGVVTAIDYATGDLKVDTGDAANPATVQINDPKGRFGRAQSLDPRFSVDDANPTIHSGTGYPMCVPRTDPAVAGGDDPACPQQNRPNLVPVTVNGATVPAVVGGCRNFSVAGFVPPKSGELTRPAAGASYCTEFVMNTVLARAVTDPDVRQQAPFEVGDSITFSGTLIPAGPPGPAGAPGPAAYFSAHTIEANVGIYTDARHPAELGGHRRLRGRHRRPQPGLDQRPGGRDRGPDLPRGPDHRRQVGRGHLPDGRQPGHRRGPQPVGHPVRDDRRAERPLAGRRGDPDRRGHHHPEHRPAATTRPDPDRQGPGRAAQPADPDHAGRRPLAVPPAGAGQRRGRQPRPDHPGRLPEPERRRQPVANGLVAGQYFAPTFDFIFPENVKPGDLLIPFDFWHLPFIVKGEGATTASAIGPSVGPLSPAPW